MTDAGVIANGIRELRDDVWGRQFRVMLVRRTPFDYGTTPETILALAYKHGCDSETKGEMRLGGGVFCTFINVSGGDADSMNSFASDVERLGVPAIGGTGTAE